jgi:hypothetical protein
MRELPTGTITLLFTDIEGSTRLLQQVGHRYDGILTACRQLLRAAFHRWNGYEVDTPKAMPSSWPLHTPPMRCARQWRCNVRLLPIPGPMVQRCMYAWVCIRVSHSVLLKAMWAWTCIGQHAS